MRLVNSDFLKSTTVNHPYESNADYTAKINTFYYSKDEKLIAGYWEAPEGWFDAEIEEQNEINYVIEGEIDLTCERKKITAKKGDCFLVQSGEKIKWIIQKPIKTIFFIYPANKEIVDFFKKFTK